MDKPKPKAKKHRQPPFKIDLPFDEVMDKIIKAKPVKKKNEKK